MSQIEAAIATLVLAVEAEHEAQRRHDQASGVHAETYRTLMEARRVRVLAEQRRDLVGMLYAA